MGGAAAQVVVARVIQAGLFFLPVIQREWFRIERARLRKKLKSWERGARSKKGKV